MHCESAEGTIDWANATRDNIKLQKNEASEVMKRYLELFELAKDKGYRLDGSCLFRDHTVYQVPNLSRRTIPTRIAEIEYLEEQVNKKDGIV